MGKYFYKFIEDVSEEMAQNLHELENAIYQSPRSMLTHSRTFIELLLEKIMIHENIPYERFYTIYECIEILDEHSLLPKDVLNALHEVRKLGNMAAHDTRQFRFSESLTAWENLYTIVKWYVEVYVSYDIEVPEYVDPVMQREETYDLEEMAIRFNRIEELLKQSLEREREEQSTENSDIAVKVKKEEPKMIKQKTISISEEFDGIPGMTPIRTITYGDDYIEIPVFLRDAFLLPQRFEQSERFLIRLGGEQEARIMSELPSSLVGFHERVTRYNESHSETFFKELKEFVAEEIRRRKLMYNRQGELFLFYKSDEIVVTEELGKIEINKENFTGMPGLIDQLNEDGIYTVRDLPKELLILGKYKGVGKSRVERFFEQLKEKQEGKE
mgnify:CR=1 FL=1